MSAVSPTPRGGTSAGALRSLLRLVVDHNPFYLLSAVCMLAGCLVLTNSLSYSPLRAGQLLALILTLNAYELLLVGLGLFLIARRGVRRDGLFLLLIECAFLVDMAFLNAEVYSVRPALGLLVNCVVYALAVAKLTAIFRTLRFPLNDGLLAFTLTQLAVLFATPGVFAKLALSHDGRLSPWIMYAAWWAAGSLPALYILLVRPRDLITTRSPHDPVRGILTKVLLLAPIVSLLIHLGTANWVYKLPFELANIAPLLLGLSIAIAHHDTHLMTVGRRAAGHLLLPALAVLFSSTFPDSLTYALPGPDCSPLRLALLVTALIYLDGFRLHRHPAFATAAALCAVTFGLGPSVTDVGATVTTAADQTQSLLDHLTPRTPRQWGVLSVIASFLLLAVGFLVSLLKPATPTPATVLSENPGDTPTGDC